MEIEYKLQPEDLIAFQQYHRRTSARTRPWIWLCILAVVVAGMILLNPPKAVSAPKVETKPEPSLLSYLPFITAVVLPLILLSSRGLVLPLVIRRQFRQGRYGKEIGEEMQHVKLAPEALSSWSARGNTVTNWNAIEKIVWNEGHGFIYLTPLQAIVIPRRAFSDDATFQQFMTAARDFHERSTAHSY